MLERRSRYNRTGLLASEILVYCPVISGRLMMKKVNGGKPKQVKKPAGKAKHTAPEPDIQARQAPSNTVSKKTKYGNDDGRREKFINNFIRNGGNASKAATEAGYISWMGQHLMNNVPAVRNEINRRLAIARSRYAITTDRVLGELAKVAFCTLDNFTRIDAEGNVRFDFSESIPEDRASIAEITQEEIMIGKGDEAMPVRKTKIKLHDKLRALETLCKHLRIAGNDSEDPDSTLSKAEKLRKALAAMLNADEAPQAPDPASQEEESRPDWQPEGSDVKYTADEVKALTPVRRTLEKL